METINAADTKHMRRDLNTQWRQTEETLRYSDSSLAALLGLLFVYTVILYLHVSPWTVGVLHGGCLLGFLALVWLDPRQQLEIPNAGELLLGEVAKAS